MTDQRAYTQLMAAVMRGSIDRRTLLARAGTLGITGTALASLLAACAGDDDAVDAADAADDSPADDTEPGEEPDDVDDELAEDTDDDPADADVAQDEVIILQGVDANTLDPAFTNSFPEITVKMHVFDLLIHRDPHTLELVPHLLEDWTMVDDHTWECKLVENATFHNGDPLNSDSATFSFNRAATEELGGRANLMAGIMDQINFESVEAVDEFTFRVNTTEPSPVFPDLMTRVEIIPESEYADDSEENLSRLGDHPIGSGPYRFANWIRDDRIELERNDDYWKLTPEIERVVIRPVPEASSRAIALMNQEAHLIVNVSPDMVSTVEEHEASRISAVDGGRRIFIGIRCDREPFDDVRARQALNYAVDWNAISNALLEGFGERMNTWVNAPFDNPDIEPYYFDPELARSLLNDAGVPEGFEVSMISPDGRYINDAEIAQAVAQHFRDVGLDIELRSMEWTLFSGEYMSSGEMDTLYLLGLGTNFEGQRDLWQFLPGFGLNYTRWEHDEYYELHDQLSVTLDRDERVEMMFRLQEILMEECPAVWLYKQVDFYGVAANLDWEGTADELISVAEARFI